MTTLILAIALSVSIVSTCAYYVLRIAGRHCEQRSTSSYHRVPTQDKVPAAFQGAFKDGELVP